jgi:23S rRNA (guanosine2251-2'-O)-methyltransferase
MRRHPPDSQRSTQFSRPSGQITVARGGEHPHFLKQYQHRRKEIAEVVFGLEPVREIIAATPSRVRRLYYKQGAETRFEPQIQAVRDSGGQVLAVASSDLARLAGSEIRHQGIVATLRDYSYASLGDVLALKPDPLLVVDGVTDPRNLGAILRSCECAGVGAIVLAKDRTVGITPTAIKSSAGAWAHLQVARCGNVAQTLKHLKEQSYWIAAMDPQGDTSLYDLDESRRLAFVLGSEGRGIRTIVRKTSDFVVRIPLYGRVSSLNVSVAAAIALFEIVRRRLSSTGRN